MKYVGGTRKTVLMEMTGSEAREFWKALIDNASALIADAQVMLSVRSFGRARSLTVLAQEELGKALWVYDAFEGAWSAGDGSPRLVNPIASHGRSHTKKYLEAVLFGDGLASFWGDFTNVEDWQREGESWEEAAGRRHSSAEAAARASNLAKQRGLYVDREDDGTISSPTQLEVGSIPEDLRKAAQVVEMLLIQDHTRMKHSAVTPYDSTHPQQFRLLPISHPELWPSAQDEIKGSRGDSGPDPEKD